MNTLQTTLTLGPITAPFAASAERARPETVSSRARTTVVKVPSWFTAGAALRVAQLKGVSHLLVVDRGVVVGSIGIKMLAAAPVTQPLARSMALSIGAVSPETSRDEAWRLMTMQGLECLPVVSGPLLVGIVTLSDLANDDLRAAG